MLPSTGVLFYPLDLVPGSPAERAALRVGDQIINGQNLTSYSLFRRVWEPRELSMLLPGISRSCSPIFQGRESLPDF